MAVMVALVPLVASCDRGYGEGPLVGIVYGAITTAAAQPIAGAMVKLVNLDRSTCTNPGPVAVDSVTTTVTGTYRLQAWSFGGGKRPFSEAACALLVVRFPAEPARDTSVTVQYRMYFGPPDSTRVDLQIAQ